MDHTIIKEAATKIVANIKAMEDDITVLRNKQDIISTSDTTMTGSYPGRLSIEEIGGKCEQFTTTGKNLLGFYSTLKESTVNGATFKPTFDSDGTLLYVEVNGTPTDTAVYLVAGPAEMNISVGESYILSGCPQNGAILQFYNIDGTGKFAYDYGSGGKFTFTNEVSDYNVAIVVEKGFTATKLQFKPMIRLASIADPTYEPYTGGQPSPNPDYPQEIKKTVVSEIRTHGKNFAKLSVNTQTLHNVDIIRNDESITIKGTSTGSDGIYITDAIKLKAGKYYTNVLMYRQDKNTNWLETIAKKSVFEVTDEEQIFRPLVWVNPDQVYNETIIPMVCFEEYKDSEEPYTESTITLSQPIELYGIGDVQDTIEDGKVVRRFATTVLDGTGGYQYFNKAISCNIVDSLIKPSDSNYVIPKILSERFSPDTPSNVLNGANENSITVSIAADTYRIRLHNDSLTSAEEAISYFTENPMTVVYELAEPVIEVLPLVDQTALNSLKTYDGITYVEIDSEIEPTFKAEYGATKLGGYTLEGILAGVNGAILGQSNTDRITALEATLVNNI